MFNMSSHRPPATNEMYEEFLHLKEFKVPFVYSSEAKETHDQPDAIKKTLRQVIVWKTKLLLQRQIKEPHIA